MQPFNCPVIDHLACKLPGEQEPRIYDVYAAPAAIAANTLLQSQSVEIGNRDAPYHLASLGVRYLSGTGPVRIRVYNSRAFGFSDVTIDVGNRFGGPNAPFPVNPSMVWPVNSSLIYDLENAGGAPATIGLFFYGFKIFDRGKAPC